MVIIRMKLKENIVLREELAQNAYDKITQNCTPKILGMQLIKIINEI